MKPTNHLEKDIINTLKKVINTEVEFEKFKAEYTKEMEERLVNKIVEKRKKNVYYDLLENKAEINKELNNLKAPGNPHAKSPHVFRDDHIKQHKLLKDPAEAERKRIQYLALYDIVCDLHLRQVRPSQIHDNKFKFVKKNYIPTFFTEDDVQSNMHHEYKFCYKPNDNKYFANSCKDLSEQLEKITKADENEQEDPV